MTDAQLLLLAAAFALMGASLLLVAAARRKRHNPSSKAVVVASQGHYFPAAQGAINAMNMDLNQLRNQLVSLQVRNPELPVVPSNVDLFNHWFDQTKQKIGTRAVRRTKQEELALIQVVNALETEFNTLIKIANERRELTDEELNDLKIQAQKEALRASIAADKAKQAALQRRDEPRAAASEQERRYEAARADRARDRRWTAHESLGKIDDLRELRRARDEKLEAIERDDTLTRAEKEEDIQLLEQDYEEQKQKIKKRGNKHEIFERER